MFRFARVAAPIALGLGLVLTPALLAQTPAQNDKAAADATKAKGLPPFRALMKYPLRMSLNPFIADIGNLLPQIISGAAIVSIVMSLPTTGPMLLRALQTQDMYLAGSFLMLLALLTVVGVLLSDVALAVLDPRIRFGGGQTR